MTRWFLRLDRAELASFFALALLLASISVAPLAISFGVTPESIERGEVRLTPPCEHLQATGEPCPACGLTRAFAALGHGRVDQAVRYHHASLPLYAGLLVVALGSVSVMLVTGARLCRRRPT